jgi:hypothetical protein
VGESFLITTKFSTKVQLKGLTHMLCFLMSSYKVYKKVPSFLFHIKNHVLFGMNLKKFNLKSKT